MDNVLIKVLVSIDILLLVLVIFLLVNNMVLSWN